MISGQYPSAIGPQDDGQHVLSMLFFLLYFRLMVGCEVEGPLWVVLGRSRGLCGRSRVALGPSAGGLGPLLVPVLAALGVLGLPLPPPPAS